MIFVSTACVQHKKICDSVIELVRHGFNNIELSGGTQLYNEFEIDLLKLKDKYKLNYRCHNYFPPPKTPFVLNLASLNQKIFKESFDHLQNAIDLSKRIGAKKFGLHAGFFIDIKLNEIGRKLTLDNLHNKKQAENRFCSAFQTLQKQNKEVSLFIENNVLSKENLLKYRRKNPFMLTSFDDFKALKKRIDFNLLLDIAHLKVSSNSLGLNWEEEFQNMMDVSDYIHISDNDGERDTNNELLKSSKMFRLLKESNTNNKTFTLEIYEGIEATKASHKVLSEAVL